MPPTEIQNGQLGPEITYDLQLNGGALKFTITRKGGLGDEEGMYGSLPAAGVVNAIFAGLESKIPTAMQGVAEGVKNFLISLIPQS